MPACRLVLIVAALVLLVQGEEIETPVAPQRDLTSLGWTNDDRRRIDRDGIFVNNGKGKMVIHTEASSSKVKREQALRNILAARRRQLVGSRVPDFVRNPSSKIPKPALDFSKEPSDMLEAQETRYGLYATVPMSNQITIITNTEEEGTSEVSGTNDISASTFADPEITNVSSVKIDETTENSLSSGTNVTSPGPGPSPWTIAESITDITAGGKNISQTFSRLQKGAGNDNRRKNTVVMPESLYNHFRPVEGNIPVEDMTQFLYFGQKLNADGRNSSSRRNNNSLVDATSTSSSILSSRRRHGMKRFGGTSPVALARLENIMKEEKNIALERATMERNKIPETRSPESGAYFKKSSIISFESTIASNVIPTRETPRNTPASIDKQLETVWTANEKETDIVSDETSDARSTAHQPEKVTISEKNSTQFASRLMRKEDGRHQRGRKLPSTSNVETRSLATNDNINSHEFMMTEAIVNESLTPPSVARDDLDVRTASTPSSESFSGLTTWQSVHNLRLETITLPARIETKKHTWMASSTINDSTGTLKTSLSSMIPTTTARPALSSSLRIIVTEPVGYAGTISGRTDEEKEGKEEKGNTEDILNLSKGNETMNDTLDNGMSSNNSVAISLLHNSTDRDCVTDSTNDKGGELTEPPRISSFPPFFETAMRQHRHPPVVPVIATVPPKTQEIEYKQQHAYAYEITNVTRLLRNYTGPGLNVAVERQIKEDKRRKESSSRGDKDEEKRKNTSNKKEKKLEDEPIATEVEREATVGEREGDLREVERSSTLTRTGAGTVPEIRRAGGSVRSTLQRQPLPLLLLLPTPLREASSSDSGGKVEPARTTGRVSAGTDVGGVTAISYVDDDFGDRGGSSDNSNIETRDLSTFPTFTENISPRHSRLNTDDLTSTISSHQVTKTRDGFTESTIVASTLRGNYTEKNKLRSFLDRQESVANDRRHLRKSVSSVHLQRTIEQSPAGEVKRRRGLSSLFSSSLNNKESVIKDWVKSDRNEGTGSTTLRSMENRTVLPDNENALSWGTENISEVDGSVTEMSTELDSDRTLETSVIPEAITTRIPMGTLEHSPRKQTDLIESDAEEPNLAISRVSSQAGSPLVPPDATNVEMNSSSPRTLSLDSSKSLLDVELSLGEEKTSTTAAPSSAAPVFPVTPKMLEESKNKVAEVDASGNETKTETGGPFGLARDLDPSEIQKIYRSQTTLRPEFVTMLAPESEVSTDSNIRTDHEEEPAPLGAGNSSIARSPEVRARNLSDKTRDKDDILPIMQLYNTSNIFNGTGRDSLDSRNTGRSSLQPSSFNDSRTFETANATSTTSRGSTEVTQSVKDPRRKENLTDSLGIIWKNNKPSFDSDYENDYAIPTRTNINITSQEGTFVAQTNRTKYRGNNHSAAFPEYLGYRPELNTSFFEPGVTSVNLREPINASEVITKRHDGDSIATQETVMIVSYILATLIVFPIAVGVGLILRRLIIRNRKVLEESDTSSEISCRKDALNLENGDSKTSIEKAITKLPRIQHLCHEFEKPPPSSLQESRWEFPRDKLRLQTVLGQGNFGQVWKAEADDLTGHQGTTRLVAVKTVKEGASTREKEDLVRELEIMQQLGNHPNVVTLLGCCTEEEPHYLILEYVMYGKLLAYLRDHRTRQDFYNFSEDSAALTSRDLTVFGYCVSRGMEYLASKKIIHRDLAARNVLVDHNKLCKIADFGMSRFANEEGEVIEARHGRNALPIRWMAPESLIYSLFTTKTDVWSFGILMWEIVTLGSTPYPDMAAREVMRNVQNGYRLERPSHCRSELFRVISRCWHVDPDRRPEFQMLRRDMAQLLEDGMNGHYVDLESFASERTE